MYVEIYTHLRCFPEPNNNKQIKKNPTLKKPHNKTARNVCWYLLGKRNRLAFHLYFRILY